ncbi:MAG: hypothetical protein JNM31_09075 [Flavobacteriales bacterium]|nr:hypothetical protein [Flavobacteriales bacterium]
MPALIRSATLFALLLLVAAGHAQDRQPRALFNDSLAITGGFFDLTFKYTEVMKTDVMQFALAGGITLDHVWNIGLGGSFAASAIKNPEFEQFLRDSASIDTQGGLELRYGYGGVFIQPILFRHSVVHLAVPVLIGVGGVNYSFPAPFGSNSQRNRVEGQAFFAFEPGLDVEITIVRGFRIAVGGSYLYTSDLSLPQTAPDVLRTASARLSLKVGGFTR